MQTLKTAVVVVLLLIVLYGVYEVLTRPDAQPPEEMTWLQEEGGAESLEIKLGFGDPSEADSFDTPSIDAPSFDSSANPTAPPPASTYSGPDQSAGGDLPPAPNDPSYGQPYGQRYDPSGSSPPANAPTDTSPTGGSGEFPSKPATSIYQTPDASSGYARTAPGDSTSVADPRLQNNPFIHERVSPQTVGAAQGATPSVTGRAFERAMREARESIEAGRFREALESLSVFYGSPDLDGDSEQELLTLLDPLAAKVIYSTDHLLDDPYQVGRNETLIEIAETFQVPWQLLQKINGTENPRVLIPHTELKVLRGPFHAEVVLAKQEVTLYVGTLYAGRFPIAIGADPAPQPGDYEVRDKQQNRAYFSTDGRTIAGGTPQNPYGKTWIDLGREMCIHGSGSQSVDPRRGCISLSPRDAEDIFSILSVGSAVKIR